MTDREKLIDLIVEGNIRAFGRSESFADIIADHLIANGVTVQQWIPVTERLPEESKTVLVYRPNMWLRMVCTKIIGGEWERYGKTIANEDAITHWMPLPEPPKERE